MEFGANTGFVLGYGSYCTLLMRYGDKAGSLQGGTKYSGNRNSNKGGTQLVPLTSAMYSRSHSVPTQRTFAVAFDSTTKSPIRTGYGVYSYSGNISFDLSEPLRDLIFDKKQEFFHRNSFLDLDLCDGEKFIEILGAVWNSLSISASEKSLVTGSIGFMSCNGYNTDIIVKKETSNKKNSIKGRDLPELQPYWQYGRDGVTSFNLNISRQVTPIYLNERDWAGPAYLRVGMLDVTADVTCWENWLDQYHKFSLGTKSIEFQGIYATNKSWNFACLNGNGTKTYNLGIYGLESTEDMFILS